jgi:hypothetical protein
LNFAKRLINTPWASCSALFAIAAVIFVYQVFVRLYLEFKDSGLGVVYFFVFQTFGWFLYPLLCCFFLPSIGRDTEQGDSFEHRH